MKHVFLETNWIISFLAPAWFHDATAASLLQRHLDGAIRIYVPVVAIHEARKKLPNWSPKQVKDFDNLANWLVQGKLELAQDLKEARERGHSALQAFEKNWQHRLLELCKTLEGSIFPYRESSMELQIELAKKPIHLDPFDQAILCSVVSEALLIRGADSGAEVLFCTKDSHLQRPECKEFVKTHGVTD